MNLDDKMAYIMNDENAKEITDGDVECIAAPSRILDKILSQETQTSISTVGH